MSELNDCKVKYMALYDEHKELTALLKEAQEFIDDCSVSHVESRYKYRAQILSKKLKAIKELEG